MFQHKVKAGHTYKVKHGKRLDRVLNVSGDFVKYVRNGQKTTTTLKAFAHSHEPSEDQRYDPSEYNFEVEQAMMIGLMVRNAMENLHSEGYIDDKLMAMLNPLIREEIAHGLVLFKMIMNDPEDKALHIHLAPFQHYPKYWERPDLKRLLSFVKRIQEEEKEHKEQS